MQTFGGFLRAAGILAVLTSLAASTTAQCLAGALTPQDVTASPLDAQHIALHEKTLVVGQPSGDAAIVFERIFGEWVETRRFDSPNPALAQFARAVDVSGDTLVIGFPDPAGGGAVLVSERSGGVWSAPQYLMNPASPEPVDSFGWSLALDGDRLAVGSPGDGTTPVGTGAVYIFERSGGAWTQTARLTSPGLASVEEYGVQVELEGPRLVVSSHDTSLPGTSGGDLGVVDIYDLVAGSWQLDVQLTLSDLGVTGNAFDDFGEALSLDDGRLLVGAPLVTGTHGYGAAYLLDRGPGGWTITQAFEADAGTGGGQFGFSVDRFENRIVIGAPYAQDGQFLTAGASFAFGETDGSWSLRSTFHHPLPGFSTKFGTSVAIGRYVALAGSVGPSVYRLNVDAVAGFTSVGPGLADPPGPPPRLEASGEPCTGQDLVLTLSGADAVPGLPVALVIGLSRLDAPLLGGTLVPDADLILFFTGGPAFAGTMLFQGTLPEILPDGLELWFQAWAQDAGGPQGWVATQGLHTRIP